MTVTSPDETFAASIPLAFRRQRIDALPDARGLLGARVVGNNVDLNGDVNLGIAAGSETFGARLLAPAGRWADAWYCGGGTVQAQRHGCVQFATDGHWLHGLAEVDDPSHPEGLAGATRQAYTDLFAVLEQSRTPHLLRLWNYIAGINVETGGVERYRQFNAGRQQAFLEAQRSAFEGSPAACALGTRSGPLRVYFLAGRRAPLAIENPRQVSAYRYPSAYGPRAPTFSRAALAAIGDGRQALFISGTASIVGHETLHLGDVRRQTAESLANIAVLREIAGRRVGHVVEAGALDYTVYVRDAADLAAVREAFERVVEPGSRAAREALYLEADICRSTLLVEIEAHACIDTAPAFSEDRP